MNRTTPRQQSNSNSDFRKYFSIVLRNWYWFAISFAITLSIAKVINLLTIRTYLVSCEITVGENENSTLTSQQIVGGIDFNEVNPINKEIGILKSKSIAEQTINQLDFRISYYELINGTLIKRRRYSKIPFQVILDENDHMRANSNIYLKIMDAEKIEIRIEEEETISQTIKINEKFSADGFSFQVKAKKEFNSSLDEFIGKEYLFYYKHQHDVVNEYWQKINVQISPTSQNILVLSIEDENIFQAIDYLNKLCEVYDLNDLQLRNRIASNTLKFIDNQLAILNQQLLAAEDSLIRFKREYKIYNAEISTSLSNQFVQLEEELSSRELVLNSIDQLKLQLDSIVDGGNIILPSLFILDDPRLSSGIENINRMVIERDILLKNQNNRSPAVIRLNQQITVESEAFKTYLSQSTSNLQKHIKSLKKEIASMESELLDLPSVDRQLAKLTRDFVLTENLYNLYQQKRIETKLAEASTVSNVRMLDPPGKDSAILISPKKKQNNQIAALLGLALPALMLILMELLTDRVRATEDITNSSNLPVVGKLAHSRADYYLPTKEYPWAGITESFRTLHAKLKFLLVDTQKNVIAITSGSSGEGKTFCAMNLATVMAGAGNKVLLIGLDLRRPKIHEVFEIDNNVGLTTYLIGNNSKEEIISATSLKNLFLMNSGPIPPNPVELIEHEKTQQLIDSCRKEYDYVIIDSPPIGLVADAMLLNKYVDVYLFVIRMDYTKKNIISLIKELEATNSLNHLSLIFNDIKQQIRYGYGYGYSYYNSYYQKEETMSWNTRIRKFLKRKR